MFRPELNALLTDTVGGGNRGWPIIQSGNDDLWESAPANFRILLNVHLWVDVLL